MTEKGKAIEDGTIELPTGPAEKKKPHRGRIVVITVAALALLAAGASPGGRTRTASWPRPGRTARPRANVSASRRPRTTRY